MTTVAANTGAEMQAMARETMKPGRNKREDVGFFISAFESLQTLIGIHRRPVSGFLKKSSRSPLTSQHADLILTQGSGENPELIQRGVQENIPPAGRQLIAPQ